MKVELERRPAHLPVFKLPVSVLELIGKVGEAAILWNIKHQQQADGSPLQENKPATKRRKQRKGRPLLSLVDQLHRFARGRGQSWSAQIDANKSWVILEPATSELARLVVYVQKMGYTGWFALNEKAAQKVRDIIRKWIQAEFDKARSKSG